MATAALVFALVAVVNSRRVSESTPPPEVPPVAPFEYAIGAVGVVEANTENIALSTPVSGLVTAVYVQVGDPVQAGQKLFSLDDRDLRAELQVRQKALELARQQLERLLRAPRPEEIPVAEARVAEAEQDLADARVRQQLIESIVDRRAISEEELQRRRIATKAAEARLRQARANLALLKAGTWEPDVRVARAQVALAEAEVQRVHTDIERLTITAPVDGQILQANVKVGEFAQSGPLAKALMLFGAVDHLHVRTDVDEHQGFKVSPDAGAYALVRGNSALRAPLQFVSFEPYVVPKRSLTGDTTERVDTRVLQVIYRLERDALPVFIGQQVDVFIEAPAVASITAITGLAQRRQHGVRQPIGQNRPFAPSTFPDEGG
jgi:multidrug efflux pump subunit AcrA (membrane-fusion protein)